MGARARTHIAHNLVGYIALFVALGGTSYAVAAGEIGSREVRDNSLRSIDVRDRGLRGRDIRNDSLGGAQIRESLLGMVPNANNANSLGGLGPNGFLRANAKAADADTLDNLDSTAFLGANAKAADADRLDNKDSTAFAPAGGHAEVDTSTGGLTGARDCQNVGVIGPSVTVEVGTSGLVAVWAEARILDFGASEARVQLFEPTDLSSCPTILRGNSATNGGFETKRTLPGNDAGTTGAGSVQIFRVTPGTRTFTLRYGGTPDAGFTYGVDFKRLWVQPL